MTATFSRISPQARVLSVVLVFWAVGWLAGIEGVERSNAYLYATSLLLAIGLFASTNGIDLHQARQHKGIILAAITVGVVVKALIIGGVLYLSSGNPLFLIIGVAVAQIDPLSVAALLGDRRMSPQAKTILSSWASFDDPVTVILVIYASAIATGSFGLTGLDGVAVAPAESLLAYGSDLLLNAVLAAVAYLVWRFLKNRPALMYLALAVLAVLAVWQFLMLAVAIAGLFVRPRRLEVAIPRVINTALLAAGGLLGLLLVAGVNLTYGALLGLLAFGAQVVVGFALTPRLPGNDRVHLAFAQQNGITAIVLALRLEPEFGGVVALVAPAILVTNVIHYVANRLIDRRLPSDTETVPMNVDADKE